jgi:hypothetical protein
VVFRAEAGAAEGYGRASASGAGDAALAELRIPPHPFNICAKSSKGSFDEIEKKHLCCYTS